MQAEVPKTVPGDPSQPEQVSESTDRATNQAPQASKSSKKQALPAGKPPDQRTGQKRRSSRLSGLKPSADPAMSGSIQDDLSDTPDMLAASGAELGTVRGAAATAGPSMQLDADSASGTPGDHHTEFQPSNSSDACKNSSNTAVLPNATHATAELSTAVRPSTEAGAFMGASADKTDAGSKQDVNTADHPDTADTEPKQSPALDSGAQATTPVSLSLTSQPLLVSHSSTVSKPAAAEDTADAHAPPDDAVAGSQHSVPAYGQTSSAGPSNMQAGQSPHVSSDINAEGIFSTEVDGKLAQTKASTQPDPGRTAAMHDTVAPAPGHAPTAESLPDNAASIATQPAAATPANIAALPIASAPTVASASNTDTKSSAALDAAPATATDAANKTAAEHQPGGVAVAEVQPASVDTSVPPSSAAVTGPAVTAASKAASIAIKLPTTGGSTRIGLPSRPGLLGSGILGGSKPPAGSTRIGPVLSKGLLQSAPPSRAASSERTSPAPEPVAGGPSTLTHVLVMQQAYVLIC